MAKIIGICPSIDEPILSGDGYLIRFRPTLGYLNKKQLVSLGKAASQFGNGVIEFTTRANISLRGIDKNKLAKLSDFLKREKIVNQHETKKTVSNVIYSPFPNLKDKEFLEISKMIEDQLPYIPKLHKKFGIAVDIGRMATLQNVHADLRLEKTTEGSLMIRIDGLEYGEAVERDNIIPLLKKLINNITKCLPRSLKGKNLAEIIHEIDYKKFHSPSKRPRNQYFLPKLGPCFKGYLLSGSAGRFTGNQLMQLADQVEEIKITPWKALFAEKTTRKPNLKFLSKNNDFLLKISHCSGQPYCKQALVDTSKLANGINKRLKYKYKSKVIDAPNIHISGCDKNCGIPKNVSIIIRKFKKNNQATVIGGAHKKLVHELLLELK